MQYIINTKILSIPPHISTSWENIVSIHMETENSLQLLVIALNNATLIKIPGLDPDLTTKIFQTHTQHLEGLSKNNPPNPNIGGAGQAFNFDNLTGFGFPMRFGGSLEGIGAAMQHNQEQANAPDLPKDVLEKVSSIAKIMSNDPNLSIGLKAEPHCNCMHCQIARAINGESMKVDSDVEEPVTEEDLKFRTWDISQTGNKLYSVTNPLDLKEQYNVFLGDPLGCTCGQKNCDHIKAVLNT
ncbi:MAG: hypothetical protein S4CHLAM7_14300 [Chlamydiae bacterium]|nr:hypothetical protein [Chlamydiota bacterium]